VGSPDITTGKNILHSLFNHLKRELDKKIDVEINDIDTQITTMENSIKDTGNEIKIKENEIKKEYNEIKLYDLSIQSKEIEKDRTKQEIESHKNKLKISEERVGSIMEEMKSVKGRIDELDRQLNKAIAGAIEAEHAPQLAFREVIQDVHTRTLRSVELIIIYGEGNENALEEIWQSDPNLLQGFKKGRLLSAEEVQVVLDRALSRFNKIETVRQSMASELESYEAELMELHRLTMEAQRAVRRARATALAWAQAHRKLASGVVDPARIDMTGITQRVLGGVL